MTVKKIEIGGCEFELFANGSVVLKKDLSSAATDNAELHAALSAVEWLLMALLGAGVDLDHQRIRDAVYTVMERITNDNE